MFFDFIEVSFKEVGLPTSLRKNHSIDEGLSKSSTKIYP
ncbi:hypothetical protein LEP1GSC055_1156 [Leptospira borgpetersenii str. Brem 307]|nr:hypothetical protein LEP1GSC055_1156 [Leptospira borgpetersenii str. Brem 307]